MNAPLALPPLPETPAPASFEGLRRQGMEAVRTLAGERWTDHNLHDPGVTLLEAACFALSDLAFRVDFPVADHLCDPQGRIDWAAHGLHLPEEAFPCRPTTTDDLRRWLLDRVPVLDGVAVAVCGPGRLELVLDAPEDQDLTRLARQVRRACERRRALGEQVEALRFVVRRNCRLRGELEVGGARDPVDVVAELYEACAAYVASAVDYESCREALARGAALDQVLEGPYTPRGIARPQALAQAASATLSVARLAAVARGVDGVRELRWLALQPAQGPAVTTSLPWRDPAQAWTLALQPPVPGTEWHGLTVLRRGMAVELPSDELARRCAELRAARLARRQGLGQVRLACPPPAGRHRPRPDPGSLQALLPAVYGVGEHLPPAHAPARRRARARQLQGYLALFDQALAQAGAQVDALRTLFSSAGGPEAPSYHWQALDDRHVPGLDGLLAAPAAAVAAAVAEGLDPAQERRSRLLDHLLALHGHEWPQNSLRRFCDHLTPRERETRLLAAKLAYARDVARLSRDRAAGIDPGRPSWEAPNNIAGLQRLAGRLLGHADLRTRALAPPPASDPPERPLARPPHARRRIDFDHPDAAGPARQPLHGPHALRRCAVRHDRWWTEPGADGRVALWLGPDEDGHWWRLGEGLTPAAAVQLAARRRRWALAQEAAAEGLHLVEHGLLRPLGAGPAPRPDAFHDLRVTALLPGWTHQGRRKAYRGFAEETLRLCAPAHLDLRCRWLGPAAMAAFEPRLRAWLALRVAWARGGAPAAAVDAAAEAVAELLDPPDPAPDAAPDPEGG